MKCPICGTWVEVMETRARADNSRRRRYVCANEHRFSTIERVEKLTQGASRRKAPTP